MNINDIAYHLLVKGIGEIVKSNASTTEDKADVNNSVALSQEIGRIIAEVRDSSGTSEQKRAKFVLRLTDTLRNFGTPEEEIDTAVKQIINQQL